MSSKRKLVNLEQYYTNPEIAKICIDSIKDILVNKTVIEPSSGTGSFSSQIDDCVAYDIDPKIDGTIKADFLEVDIVTTPKNTVVIGNPPFGRQSKLAFKFLDKSMQIADTVAFILPKSFSKPSYQNRISLDFSLLLEKELPENSFIFEGKKYDVPCVWQVWVKSPRNKQKTLKTPLFFNFTHRKDASIAIRRVGAKAGTLYERFETLSESSNYFIKCDEKAIEIFKSIEWNLDKKKLNSISKHQLISKFNELYDKNK